MLPKIIFCIILLKITTSAQAGISDLCRLFGICENGPVIDGVSVLTPLDCERLFIKSPYIDSPFVNHELCSNYQLLMQNTNVHNRIFFIKTESNIISIDNYYIAEIQLGNEPKLRFFVDFGVSDRIEITELERIHRQYELPGPKPYVGRPLQVNEVAMMADFNLIKADKRHQFFQFDPELGISLFTYATISRFESQSLAVIEVGLTELGKSLIHQSFELAQPLWGFLSWRVIHKYGAVSLSSVGDLACIKSDFVDGTLKLKPCPN